jgi:hypothetical protein
MDIRQFRVLPEHITLLQNAYVDWWDCEYGAPAIDCKRPYGNSRVARDIARLLGAKLDEDGEIELSDEEEARLRRLHEETATALQIFLRTGTMTPGLYEATSWQENWKRIGD